MIFHDLCEPWIFFSERERAIPSRHDWLVLPSVSGSQLGHLIRFTLPARGPSHVMKRVPVTSMSDKETVLPVSLCSSLFANVSVSGGISTCSLSSRPTILCVCSSSFVRRVSRDEIAFLLELDWLMDSLDISCSWQQTDSILWHNRSKIESIVSMRVTKYLTIIPRARMGSERVNSPWGRRPNGLFTHRPWGERNNCFSKIELVGQK